MPGSLFKAGGMILASRTILPRGDHLEQAARLGRDVCQGWPCHGAAPQAPHTVPPF